MHIHAKNLSLSDQTDRQILHYDLNYHPYKILYTQQLLPADHTARTVFNEVMLSKIESSEIPLKAILITNKTHFYLNKTFPFEDSTYEFQLDLIDNGITRELKKALQFNITKINKINSKRFGA